MLTTAIPSSRHNHASGYWVMLMTSQPASLNHFDSAFVEKRGPWMTTTVPRSWTSMPWSRIVVDRELAKDRVVDIGRREVGHDRAVVERVDAAAGAVDELVAHDEVAGLDVELRATPRRTGRSPP